MNCEEFESMLNVALDQRDNPRHNKMLRQHAESCDPCSRTLDIYSAIGAFSSTESDVTVSRIDRRRVSTYVMTLAAAAAVLFVLLSPVGDLFNMPADQVGMAHAAPTNGESQNETTDSATENQSSRDPEFWQRRQFSEMVPLDGFVIKVPRAPNLQDVGQSINSVWQRLQADSYVMPFLKQGALFWIPR